MQTLRLRAGAAIVGIAALLAATASNDTLARQQRSHRVIAEFKRAHPCPATGKTRSACPGFVIDHIIALACNGDDLPTNMQWQTTADAKAKDRWERMGCK